MKLSNYGRNFLHRRVVANLFIYYLTTMFITKITNYMKLERILSGKPLTCIRVTPRQASPRGSWTSLPCLLVGVAPVPCQENHNYINHNFHIIHHIHSFLYYYSSRNLFYLGIGINLFGSSKLKLWHFHAN